MTEQRCPTCPHIPHTGQWCSECNCWGNPPVPNIAHARTGDPWTSHAAAASIPSEHIRRSQQAVLDLLELNPAGMHDVAIQKAYATTWAARGWPKQSESGLRTRRSELVDAGRVKDSGRTVTLESGRRAIVWELAK